MWQSSCSTALVVVLQSIGQQCAPPDLYMPGRRYSSKVPQPYNPHRTRCDLTRLLDQRIHLHRTTLPPVVVQEVTSRVARPPQVPATPRSASPSGRGLTQMTELFPFRVQSKVQLATRRGISLVHFTLFSYPASY